MLYFSVNTGWKVKRRFLVNITWAITQDNRLLITLCFAVGVTRTALKLSVGTSEQRGERCSGHTKQNGTSTELTGTNAQVTGETRDCCVSGLISISIPRWGHIG